MSVHQPNNNKQKSKILTGKIKLVPANVQDSHKRDLICKI